MSHLVVVLPHEEGLHPHHLPVPPLLLPPTPPPCPRPPVGPGYDEATFWRVETSLVIIETVLGSEDMAGVKDTAPTGVVTSSKVDLEQSVQLLVRFDGIITSDKTR